MPYHSTSDALLDVPGSLYLVFGTLRVCKGRSY
jgi:hypothetical protein